MCQNEDAVESIRGALECTTEDGSECRSRGLERSLLCPDLRSIAVIGNGSYGPMWNLDKTKSKIQNKIEIRDLETKEKKTNKTKIKLNLILKTK